MTPASKHNTKWIITIVTGLITIITFTFFIGVGFANNESDHVLITAALQAEIEGNAEETRRSKSNDIKTNDFMQTINERAGRMETTQRHIMKSIEKIEGKM